MSPNTATTTYAYLGTSNVVSSMSAGTIVTTTSLIDAIGDRLAQGGSGGVVAWLVPDLHGNIAAALSPGSNPVLLSAYRYDAYGETCGSWSADTGSIAVPWRFQGRLLESSSGATDLYDFTARSYDPSLGSFTSFDLVAGSAQNPLTLNRYLYANANPATLVDPDGHAVQNCGFDNKGKWSCTYETAGRSGEDGGGTGVAASPPQCKGHDCNKATATTKTTTQTAGYTPTATQDTDGCGIGIVGRDACNNIAAENEVNRLFALCLKGDKFACDKMKTIEVDFGDPGGNLLTMVKIVLIEVSRVKNLGPFRARIGLIPRARRGRPRGAWRGRATWVSEGHPRHFSGHLTRGNRVGVGRADSGPRGQRTRIRASRAPPRNARQRQLVGSCERFRGRMRSPADPISGVISRPLQMGGLLRHWYSTAPAQSDGP